MRTISYHSSRATGRMSQSHPSRRPDFATVHVLDVPEGANMQAITTALNGITIWDGKLKPKAIMYQTLMASKPGTICKVANGIAVPKSA